jgi:hypothetical protein
MLAFHRLIGVKELTSRDDIVDGEANLVSNPGVATAEKQTSDTLTKH